MSDATMDETLVYVTSQIPYHIRESLDREVFDRRTEHPKPSRSSLLAEVIKIGFETRKQVVGKCGTLGTDDVFGEDTRKSIQRSGGLEST